MTSEQQVIKLIPWVKIDDQSIISNPSKNSLLLLNEPATLIWQAFRSGQNLSQISRMLKDTYKISTLCATADVESMLNQWRQSGLMETKILKENSRRWQKHHQSIHAPLSDKKPLRQIAYQLISDVFVVDYYDDGAFNSIHAVLSHLEVNHFLDQGCINHLPRYQIDYHGKYELSESDNLTRRFNTLDELVEAIQWTLIERAYQGHNWLAVLHSAALGTKSGRGIVFIARRGSGKSTLSRLLQKQGFTYLADDIVPINYAGELQPVPMCQRFKQGSWKLLNIGDCFFHRTLARDNGQYVKYLKPLTGSIREWAMYWPVNTIIYPQYSSNLKQYQFEKLNPIHSIARLCHSGSVFGGAIDQQQLESIVSWIRSVPSYSLNYPKVNSGVAELIRTLVY